MNNLPDPQPMLPESECHKYVANILAHVQSEHLFDFIGNLDLLNRIPVGFSGSRQTTQLNCKRIEEFSVSLAEQNALIISGGAQGTDSAAHQGALASSRGATLIFPPLSLYDQTIANRFGHYFQQDFVDRLLILSSFDPEESNFTSMPLIRNELIAAFSGACIIGQTGSKGGTISTINHCRRLQTPLYYLEPTKNCSAAWKQTADFLGPIAKKISWNTDKELVFLSEQIMETAAKVIQTRLKKSNQQMDLF